MSINNLKKRNDMAEPTKLSELLPTITTGLQGLKNSIGSTEERSLKMSMSNYEIVTDQDGLESVVVYSQTENKPLARYFENDLTDLYMDGNLSRFNHYGDKQYKRVASIAGKYLARFKRIKGTDRKSTRLNSSHVAISYAVFCLKKKKQTKTKNIR